MAQEYRNLIIAGARCGNPAITDKELTDLLVSAIEVGKQAIRAREVGISLEDAYKAVYVFNGERPEMEPITKETELMFINYAREVMIERMEQVM